MRIEHKKAGRLGFEPRFYGPEPYALPLDYLPVSITVGRTAIAVKPLGKHEYIRTNALVKLVHTRNLQLFAAA